MAKQRVVMIGAAALILAAMGVAAAAWLGSDERAQRLALKERQAEARAGLMAMLERSDALGEAVIVLGREIAEGRWDFRGQLKGSSGERPFYGQAEATCETELSRPACWRISKLEVGGATVDEMRGEAGATDALRLVGAGRPSTETASDGVSPLRSEAGAGEAASEAVTGAEAIKGAEAVTEVGAVAAEARAEASDAATPPRALASVPLEPTSAGREVEGGAPEAAAAPTVNEVNEVNEVSEVAAVALAPSDTSPQPVETASAAPPATAPVAPTHIVISTRINVRQGPGRRYASYGLARRGQLLEMLEPPQGQWARFRLIGGRFDDTEAWLFMPLIRPQG